MLAKDTREVPALWQLGKHEENHANSAMCIMDKNNWD